MNRLSFARSDENELSFELLVDGTPLGNLVGARDTRIPYWIFEDDLPRYPPTGQTQNPLLRIVTVCSCGEYGCGHTQCEVVTQAEQVLFRKFDCDVTASGSRMEFRFSRANYDDVIAEIIAAIRAHKPEGVS